MDMMKANVYDKPGHCEVKQVPVPEIGPHQVLIKVCPAVFVKAQT